MFYVSFSSSNVFKLESFFVVLLTLTWLTKPNILPNPRESSLLDF